MKNISIGFILGILSLFVYNDVMSSFNNYKGVLILPRTYVFNVFSHNCTKDISKNGHGWIFMNREYHRCNKLEILISDILHGERTRPFNKEMHEKRCKKCRL